MEDILKTVRRALQENADEKIRESYQRFFKEEVRTYGMKSATAQKIGRKAFDEIKHKSKEEIFALCSELWKSGYLEEAAIACAWSYNIRKQFVPEDFAVLESWVENYVTNWGTCDVLCNTVGEFIEMYPRFVQELKRWAHSENRWMKRAAAVSLVVPAKKGMFLDGVFGIADILLTDPDDMVQKGYGWMLKEAAREHQTEVFNYIMSKKAVMPRTSLRYAIEKMPKELKTLAMAK